jgi:hypothetical protein
MRLLIISIFIFLLTASCSRRYITFMRESRGREKGIIGFAEYQQSLDKYYIMEKKEAMSDLLNYAACYVLRDTSFIIDRKIPTYKVIRFFPNGELVESNRIQQEINNQSIKEVGGIIKRYQVNGNELQVEYLLTRDYELYNIRRYARINGDAIIFYKTENLQLKTAKKVIERQELYQVSPDLTATPKLGIE